MEAAMVLRLDSSRLINHKGPNTRYKVCILVYVYMRLP